MEVERFWVGGGVGGRKWGEGKGRNGKRIFIINSCFYKEDEYFNMLNVFSGK